MKPEVLEKEPMNLVEVKKALQGVKSDEEELNFRAAKTEEYVQEFARIKPKQAEELVKKLLDLGITRFKEKQAHKMVDLLPRTDKQVKMILSTYHMTIPNEDIKKILDTIEEIVPRN